MALTETGTAAMTPATNTPGAPNAALKETAAPGDGVDLQHPLAAHVTVDPVTGLNLAPDARRWYAIMGFASSSRAEIPVDDGKWELWGLNQFYRHIARADRWFDIHANWREELVPGTDHEGWLSTCGMPVYMGEAQPSIPTSVTYPLKAVIAHFGVDYFTSSIAYMVALALYEIEVRVDRELAQALEGGLDPRSILVVQRQLYESHTIGLFGIDLIVGEEYFYQKSCCEFWLGVASARGICIHLPNASALCKTPYRYGYEREPDTILKLSEFVEAKKQIEAQKEAALRTAFTLDGAIQRDEYWKQLIELRLRGAAR